MILKVLSPSRISILRASSWIVVVLTRVLVDTILEALLGLRSSDRATSLAQKGRETCPEMELRGDKDGEATDKCDASAVFVLEPSASCPVSLSSVVRGSIPFALIVSLQKS